MVTYTCPFCENEDSFTYYFKNIGELKEVEIRFDCFYCKSPLVMFIDTKKKEQKITKDIPKYIG